MPSTQSFRIAVFPGDGIGPEVMDPCLAVLEKAVARVGGFSLRPESLESGAGTYQAEGVALPERSLSAARAADAVLLGAMGDPNVRYPDGTEVVPQIELRMALELYAGIRPVRAIKGAPGPLADPRAASLDFVLIRESTEGLFHSMKKGIITDDREARETLLITRNVCERLFDTAFALARKRRAQGYPGRVTCIDKANVFTAFAFFRKIFDERAALHPDIEADHVYVDATALNMVRDPFRFDVAVTENMFGDILSDLGAGLIGGMGMAPSADVGDNHAVFQPCHGTAPDIAGRGLANPTAMILSGAMMLEHLADRRDCPEAEKAAARIYDAVDTAFTRNTLTPVERGGTAGTREIANAILQALD